MVLRCKRNEETGSGPEIEMIVHVGLLPKAESMLYNYPKSLYPDPPM